MKILIIDPGHGGDETGTKHSGYEEADLNLVIAKRVRELLAEYKPDMTRIVDIRLDPADRAALIKDKYEYCISIHLNAGGGSGIETIYSIFSRKGKNLAKWIAGCLKAQTGLPIRRTFSRKNLKGTDYYYMHRMTGSTCTIIVEGLFLDNPNDIKKMNVESIAQGIAQGFKKYIN